MPVKFKNLNKKYLIIGILAVILVAGAITWQNWPYHEYKGLNMSPELDVADNIMQAPDNKFFATALYNLEYTTFLHGDGPFTVFVPTDKAYGNLPESSKIFLGDLKNQGTIRQVVLYHVVKGKYLTSDLKENMTLKTVQGEDLKFNLENGFWMINNNSFIETTNIVSTNGVIHIVNNYLLPPSFVGQ